MPVIIDNLHLKRLCTDRDGFAHFAESDNTESFSNKACELMHVPTQP